MAAHTASDMADQPERPPTNPEAKPEADGGGERAVDDRHRARRAAEQDRLGQRAMDGASKPAIGASCSIRPAPRRRSWKKVRKKLDAAKAIDRPNTIWISRRKPPEVSPKASVRPVTMMMITADDLGDRPLDRIEDLIERLLPRHVGAGGAGRRRSPARRRRRPDRRRQRTVASTVESISITVLLRDRGRNRRSGRGPRPPASSASRRAEPRPARTAIRSIVSAISARGTVTTASWMSCSRRRSAPMRRAGVNRADAAGMAGAPGLEEIQRLGAAHLADRNAIGPQPKGRAHEIGQRGGAILGAQRHEVRRGALQLARVFDQHHAVAGLGDLREQRVDERGLAGRCAAGDEDVLAVAHSRCAAARPARST